MPMLLCREAAHGVSEIPMPSATSKASSRTRRASGKRSTDIRYLPFLHEASRNGGVLSPHMAFQSSMAAAWRA